MFITLRHEGQSIWKLSRVLKESSSALMRTIHRCDETGSYEERKTRSYLCCRGEVHYSYQPQKMTTISLHLRLEPHKRFTEIKYQTHLTITCSEETAKIRPLWSKFWKEAATEEQEEEKSFGQETQEMDLRTSGNLYFGLINQNLRFFVPATMSLWDE